MMRARALVITVASIHAVEAGFALTNPQSGKCLGVNTNAGWVDGANIDVRTCDGQPWQVWNWFNGALMSDVSDHCIDFGFEGSNIELRTCNSSRVNQQWEMSHDGTLLIVNPTSGLCMSIDETDGHNVQLGACNVADVNSKWSGGFALKNPQSGKCLDIIPSGGGWVDGADIDVRTCDGQPWQVWTWSNGALMNPYSGKCIDIDMGWEWETSRMILWTCNSSQVNQHWETPHDGTPLIVNPNSGLCMSIAESHIAEIGGHWVWLSACNVTDVNSRWSQDGLVEAITSDSVDQPHDETRMVMV
jgi:hypothetical protein